MASNEGGYRSSTLRNLPGFAKEHRVPVRIILESRGAAITALFVLVGWLQHSKLLEKLAEAVHQSRQRGDNNPLKILLDKLSIREAYELIKLFPVDLWVNQREGGRQWTTSVYERERLEGSLQISQDNTTLVWSKAPDYRSESLSKRTF